MSCSFLLILSHSLPPSLWELFRRKQRFSLSLSTATYVFLAFVEGKMFLSWSPNMLIWFCSKNWISPWDMQKVIIHSFSSNLHIGFLLVYEGKVKKNTADIWRGKQQCWYGTLAVLMFLIKHKMFKGLLRGCLNISLFLPWQRIPWLFLFFHFSFLFVLLSALVSQDILFVCLLDFKIMRSWSTSKKSLACKACSATEKPEQWQQ